MAKSRLMSKAMVLMLALMFMVPVGIMFAGEAEAVTPTGPASPVGTQDF